MRNILTIAFYPAHPEREITNISVNVRFVGKNFKHTIGVSVKTKDWNSETQKVRRSDSRFAEYNRYLDRYYKVVERLLRNERVTIDARFWEDIEYALQGEETPEHAEDNYICDYIEKIFIPRNGNRMELKRISRFHRLVSILTEYQRKKKTTLKFTDITLRFQKT